MRYVGTHRAPRSLPVRRVVVSAVACLVVIGAPVAAFSLSGDEPNGTPTGQQVNGQTSGLDDVSSDLDTGDLVSEPGTATLSPTISGSPSLSPGMSPTTTPFSSLDALTPLSPLAPPVSTTRKAATTTRKSVAATKTKAPTRSSTTPPKTSAPKTTTSAPRTTTSAPPDPDPDPVTTTTSESDPPVTTTEPAAASLSDLFSDIASALT